jgi:hypothetical protein
MRERESQFTRSARAAIERVELTNVKDTNSTMGGNTDDRYKKKYLKYKTKYIKLKLKK